MIMETILIIGPGEWEKVVEAYYMDFPGRDLGSLHQNYTAIHHRKVPTNNLIMLEVRLAKKIKYMIGDCVQLRGRRIRYN